MPALDKKNLSEDKAPGRNTGGVILRSPEELRRCAENVERLLDKWMADETGYDEETWPELKKALEEDRLSPRRLFDDENRPA